ncbi:MAG TPA: hypothetical protein VFE62_14590 [Gemmataceae bacterium]|nr:hypothetical protein [Gemmataceae bacterium]
MATLEQRASWFRFNGKRNAQPRNTSSITANGLKGGIEKTLLLLEQRVLKMPDAIAAGYRKTSCPKCFRQHD